MNFFSLIPLPYKVALAAALVAAIGIVYGIWHHAIYKSGYDACQSAQEKAVKEGEKRYEKTSIEVQRMPDAALRREFCSWVRDSDLPACLKDLAPFR